MAERTGFDAGHVHDLEQWIDAMTAELPPLTNFILPVSSLFFILTLLCPVPLVEWLALVSMDLATGVRNPGLAGHIVFPKRL